MVSAQAVDTVDHTLRLSKLDCYDITGPEGDRFRSYPSNVVVHCAVDGCKSGEPCVSSGVPQGTILGSLLFLVHINDVSNCLRYSQSRMYADDTCIT